LRRESDLGASSQQTARNNTDASRRFAVALKRLCDCGETCRLRTRFQIESLRRHEDDNIDASRLKRVQ